MTTGATSWPLVSVALIIQNGQGVLLSSGSVTPRLCCLSWNPRPPNQQIEAVGPGSNNSPSVYTRFKRGKEPSLLPPLVARNRADSVYSPCPAGMNSSLPGCLLPGSTGNAGPIHGVCVCVNNVQDFANTVVAEALLNTRPCMVNWWFKNCIGWKPVFSSLLLSALMRLSDTHRCPGQRPSAPLDWLPF